MSELNYDPTDPDKMKLPEGKTCGDCVNIKRCKAIFGHVESDTSCDWSPSRFQELKITGASEVESILTSLRLQFQQLEQLDFNRAITFYGANFYAGVLEQLKREGKNTDGDIVVQTGMRKITIHKQEQTT